MARAFEEDIRSIGVCPSHDFREQGRAGHDCMQSDALGVLQA
jgi:hypothetical protein